VFHIGSQGELASQTFCVLKIPVYMLQKTYTVKFLTNDKHIQLKDNILQ